MQLSELQWTKFIFSSFLLLPVLLLLKKKKRKKKEKKKTWCHKLHEKVYAHTFSFCFLFPCCLLPLLSDDGQSSQVPPGLFCPPCFMETTIRRCITLPLNFFSTYEKKKWIPTKSCSISHTMCLAWSPSPFAWFSWYLLHSLAYPGAMQPSASLKPRLSVPDFVSQLWRKSGSCKITLRYLTSMP